MRRLGDESIRVLSEEPEVFAEVEDEEFLLVLVGRDEVFARPGTEGDPLPELRLRPNDLEEDEIQNLRHVDTESSMSTLIVMAGFLSLTSKSLMRS